MCGTLDYLAPEIVANEDYGYDVDNWCVGVLCYEMIKGYPPFEHDSQKETRRRITALSYKFNFRFSDGARDLISKVKKKPHIFIKGKGRG